MSALAKAGLAHGLLLQAWSQSAGGYGNALRVPMIHDRVGGGGLCLPEPERGRVWEPSQGSHNNRGESGSRTHGTLRYT